MQSFEFIENWFGNRGIDVKKSHFKKWLIVGDRLYWVPRPTYLTDENGNELGFDGDSVCYCPRIDVEIDQQNNIIRLIEE